MAVKQCLGSLPEACSPLTPSAHTLLLGESATLDGSLSIGTMERREAFPGLLISPAALHLDLRTPGRRELDR